MPTVKEILSNYIKDENELVKNGDKLILSYQKTIDKESNLRATITHEIEVSTDFDFEVDEEDDEL